VGLPDDEDDFNFKERFIALKTELEAQLQEEARLSEVIAQNLANIKL
jgi:type I restriction enzyme M protein